MHSRYNISLDIFWSLVKLQRAEVHPFICTSDVRTDIKVVLVAVKRAGFSALHMAGRALQADTYLQRLAAEAGRPIRLRAFLKYARDLREANLKAKIDLWLTCHNNGELHHWIDASSTGFKRRKRARLEEEAAAAADTYRAAKRAA